jgi:hypothetical protein
MTAFHLNIMPVIILLTAAGSQVGLTAFCQAEKAEVVDGKGKAPKKK